MNEQEQYAQYGQGQYGQVQYAPYRQIQPGAQSAYGQAGGYGADRAYNPYGIHGQQAPAAGPGGWTGGAAAQDGYTVERDPRLPRLIEQVKTEISRNSGDQTEGDVSLDTIDAACNAVCAAIDADGTPLEEVLRLRVRNDLLGYGALQKFLDDESVTEIMVNSHDMVFVERAGRIERVGEVLFDNERDVVRIIERIATQCARRCDGAQPMMDARLPDGSRVNAVINPISRFGAALTIRKFPKQRLTAQDLIANGSIGIDMMNFLASAVQARCNILVSGGTGSGKTTLLNILAGFIPPDQRVITIEDTAELQLAVENWISMEARTANTDGTGAVDIHQMVVNSLRMRPDRIIVGECRSDEAVEMLQAMNTGHDGSLTTIHANDPVSAFLRLTTMVQGATNLTEGNINKQIATAVQLVVQIKRFSDGSRKISEILALTGKTEGEAIVTTPLFRFQQTGFDQTGRITGSYAPTGSPCPTEILNRIEMAGAYFDSSWFIPKEAM